MAQQQRRQPTFTSCPGPHDVLQGRGGATNNHSGNKKFRDLVLQYQDDYKAAPKADKPRVAQKLVSHWRNLNPPGRFLAKTAFLDPAGAVIWEDIGDRAAQQRASKNLGEQKKRKTTSQVVKHMTPSLTTTSLLPHPTDPLATTAACSLSRTTSFCSSDSTVSSSDAGTIDLNFILMNNSPPKRSGSGTPQTKMLRGTSKKRRVIMDEDPRAIHKTELAQQPQLGRPSDSFPGINQHQEYLFRPGPSSGPSATQYSTSAMLFAASSFTSPNDYFTSLTPSLCHDPFSSFNQKPTTELGNPPSIATSGIGTGIGTGKEEVGLMKQSSGYYAENEYSDLTSSTHFNPLSLWSPEETNQPTLSNLPYSIPTAAYLTEETFGDDTFT